MAYTLASPDTHQREESYDALVLAFQAVERIEGHRRRERRRVAADHVRQPVRTASGGRGGR